MCPAESPLIHLLLNANCEVDEGFSCAGVKPDSAHRCGLAVLDKCEVH